MGNKLVKGENDLATLQPLISAEWDETKNNGLLPTDVTSKSGKRIWWKCNRCGNSWQATVHNRVHNRTGCPICAKHLQSSFPEQALFFYIKQLFPDAVNKYIYSGQKEIDIYIPSLKIGIEHDGVNWHTNPKKDEQKNIELKAMGIDLIRVRERHHKQEQVVQQSQETCCTIKYDTKGNEYLTGIQCLEMAIENTLCVLYILGKKQIPPRVIETLIDIERDTGAILAQYYSSLKENTLAVKFPEIAAEWDDEKNGSLKPENVPYGFDRKVWWKCSQYGHSFPMAVKTRTGLKCGCPYCARQKVWPGFNDLATTNPEIAAQWDYERNETKPSDYLSGSNKKVWWKCQSCGQSYFMSIGYRTTHNSAKCPYCNGKNIAVGINDLATTHPEIAAQWENTKNTVKPTEVTFGSGEEVWWKCDICGGSYLMRVAEKASQKIGCPYCHGSRVLVGVNDLASRFPDLVKEWDAEKNDNAPSEYTYGAKDKVWWKCRKCGCSWQAVISNRTKSERPTGCPQCAVKRRSKLNSRPVICVETQIVYSGVVAAEKETGINRRFIAACCKGKRESAGNYHWKYKDVEKELDNKE